MTNARFGLMAAPRLTDVSPDVQHSTDNMYIERITSKVAAQLVIKNHYLHRRPAITFAYGLFSNGEIVGVVTFGSPPSRHVQISACRTDPNKVIELNRMWLDEGMPKNTASWFVARALKELPPRIVVSYADTAQGHDGTVYRAMNWKWAGWTDMGKMNPRVDYVPVSGKHSRDAARHGWYKKVPRSYKHRYWTTTGTPTERRALVSMSTWPAMDWAKVQDKPMPKVVETALAEAA